MFLSDKLCQLAHTVDGSPPFFVRSRCKRSGRYPTIVTMKARQIPNMRLLFFSIKGPDSCGLALRRKTLSGLVKTGKVDMSTRRPIEGSWSPKSSSPRHLAGVFYHSRLVSAREPRTRIRSATTVFKWDSAKKLPGVMSLATIPNPTFPGFSMGNASICRTPMLMADEDDPIRSAYVPESFRLPRKCQRQIPRSE